MHSRKKKLLVVNSHVSLGGLGQYSISLANAVTATGLFDVFGLVTHSNTGRFPDFCRSTNKTAFIGTKKKIIKYGLILGHIWRLRPDVVVINYNASVHFLLPLLPKTKVISILHSDDQDYYRVAAINRSCVDAWIAPTPKTKDGLIDYLQCRQFNKKIHVIPHGVAESTIAKRAINPGKFKIIFVGALYKHKGVDLLPEIFSRFLQEHPNASLTIAGDGPMRDELLQEIRQLNLEDQITLAGAVSPESVRTLFHQADVLLFPTRLEGFGLVIAEAMMEGCVPVVTHLQDITDSIVSHGETGYLVNKDDIAGFVGCLSLLYNDRAQLGRMASRSAHRARERFSLSGMAKDYVDLFNRI
jgi:glycosyltransferase involved in cell wall biosynthesis